MDYYPFPSSNELLQRVDYQIIIFLSPPYLKFSQTNHETRKGQAPKPTRHDWLYEAPKPHSLQGLNKLGQSETIYSLSNQRDNCNRNRSLLKKKRRDNFKIKPNPWADEDCILP